MTHITGNVVIDGYRLRNDDGSETTATWKAATSTSAPVPVGETFRLRIWIRETAGGSANAPFDLQYSLNGSTLALVTTTTPVRWATSTNVTDGASTTQQISTGTFAGGVIDSNGDTGNQSISNSSLENEYVLTLNEAQLTNGDTLTFFTTNLNAVNVTPTLTVFIDTSVSFETDLILSNKSLNFIELTLDTTSNVDTNLARNEKNTSYQELDLDLKTPFETDLALVTLNTSYQDFIFDKTDNFDINLTRNEKTLNFIELTLTSSVITDLVRNEKTLNFIELILDATSNVDTNLAQNEKTTSYQELTFDKTDNIDVNLTRSEKTTSYQEFTLDAVRNFGTDLLLTTSNIQYQALEFVVIVNLDTNLVRNEKKVQYQALAIRNAIHNLTTSDITSASARFNWEYDDSFA